MDQSVEVECLPFGGGQRAIGGLDLPFQLVRQLGVLRNRLFRAPALHRFQLACRCDGSTAQSDPCLLLDIC